MSGIKELGSAVVEGWSKSKLDRVEQRVEGSLGSVKAEVGNRIEALAEEIRMLGKKLDNPEEAQRIARELERTADYLRYRRTTDMFSDSLATLRRHRTALLTGAAVGALTIFLVTRRMRA